MPIASPAALRLAVAVRDLLTMHPSLHCPNLWIGSTAHSLIGCVGGWTALLDGARPHPAGRTRWRSGYKFVSIIGPSGAPILIRDYCTTRLGLDRDERDQLLSEPETTTAALSYLNSLITSAAHRLQCPKTTTYPAAEHRPVHVPLLGGDNKPRTRS
ncbi:hypothetical protein [Nocardia asiatica]